MFTTNLADKGLTNRLSVSLVDRMVNESTIVRFKGTSRRRPRLVIQ